MDSVRANFRKLKSEVTHIQTTFAACCSYIYVACVDICLCISMYMYKAVVASSRAEVPVIRFKQ